MSEVITFVNYRPPARFDSLPWTDVRIEESATEDGTYTQIDTVALSPLDADPSDPAYRSFTTELGTDVELWYRVIFGDADGDTSQPTTPVQNLAETAAVVDEPYASVSELARILRVNEADNDEALLRVLLTASGEINSEIGRTAGDLEVWETALADEVALERAAEHWARMKAPFGLVGLGAELGPTHTSKDSWEPHAHKLAAIKDAAQWGLA